MPRPTRHHRVLHVLHHVPLVLLVLAHVLPLLGSSLGRPFLLLQTRKAKETGELARHAHRTQKIREGTNLRESQWRWPWLARGKEVPWIAQSQIGTLGSRSGSSAPCSAKRECRLVTFLAPMTGRATRTNLLEVNLGVETSVANKVDNPSLSLLTRHAKTVRKLSVREE